MTKQGMRGFSGGMILAAAVIALFYYTFYEPIQNENTASDITENQFDQYLERNNMIAIDKSTYQSLQASATQPKREKTSKAEPEKDTATKKKQEESEEIFYKTTLKIESGMSSQEVVSLLEKDNIISDKEAFNHYLDEHNLFKQVQIGTYKLNSSMTIEEIAKKITS